MGFEQLAALRAQLNQNAKSAKGASSVMPSRVKAAGDIKQQSSPPRTSADAAARAVATLQKNFPRAFPQSPTPKVPLKVGILKDVLAQAASLGLSERDVRNGIKLWCRGHLYWTCLTEGSARVDLHGAVVGVVSADEAEYGASQERVRLTRRREQIAKHGGRRPR
ncbi:ProQ activator of osmoprotectant transporter ProP [Caballeronia arvi]|uniref:ProQ activator of osmoprotectant transporter ProP n=1 Tax=Caballeronia arvi TaxID=1777135 RepID=A0A158L0Y3_9BURK|nr:ProQ/FinO family protein [Caballeronia arvi]SAL86311.1 ProQ activator of osmoprotectant transporter ProP [Caballeronia arvi]